MCNAGRRAVARPRECTNREHGAGLAPAPAPVPAPAVVAATAMMTTTSSASSVLKFGRDARPRRRSTSFFATRGSDDDRIHEVRTTNVGGTDIFVLKLDMREYGLQIKLECRQGEALRAASLALVRPTEELVSASASVAASSSSSSSSAAAGPSAPLHEVAFLHLLRLLLDLLCLPSAERVRETVKSNFFFRAEGVNIIVGAERVTSRGEHQAGSDADAFLRSSGLVGSAFKRSRSEDDGHRGSGGGASMGGGGGWGGGGRSAETGLYGKAEKAKAKIVGALRRAYAMCFSHCFVCGRELDSTYSSCAFRSQRHLADAQVAVHISAAPIEAASTCGNDLCVIRSLHLPVYMDFVSEARDAFWFFAYDLLVQACEEAAVGQRKADLLHPVPSAYIVAEPASTASGAGAGMSTPSPRAGTTTNYVEFEKDLHCLRTHTRGRRMREACTTNVGARLFILRLALKQVGAEAHFERARLRIVAAVDPLTIAPFAFGDETGLRLGANLDKFFFLAWWVLLACWQAQVRAT